MIKYQFKERPLVIPNADKADAQVIGEAIAKISAEHGGQLKPEYVWRAAENNKRHPLHKHFPWNERAAAEAHWTDIARTLIRSIDIVSDDNDHPQPAFISITTLETGASYRTLRDVQDSVELQVAALKQAERDFEAYEKRLRSFRDICDAILDVRKKISAKRANMENRPSV